MEEFYLEESLGEAKTLSFKFNLGDSSGRSKDEFADEVREQVDNISMYVAEHSRAYYMSAGRHMEGKNERPHVHVNFVVHDYVGTSHESRRRNKYFMDMGYSKIHSLSMREGIVNDMECAQKCLAYPMKEGLLVSSSHIPDSLLTKLEVYAGLEYEKKLQRDLEKQRAGERTEKLQNQILALIPKNMNFTDYFSYKQFIYTKFYSSLQINEYPQRRSVESAVQNIAIFKKIVDPWYFDKF